MRIKFFLLLLLCQVFCTDTDAQKVKRKGVNPIDVSIVRKHEKTPQYTVNQLLGKWQEVARKEKSTGVVLISDTIYLNFTTLNAVSTKEGNQPVFKGAVEIVAPGNVLLAAADVYTILSVTADEIMLDNQENIIHTLKKTNQFWHETFGKNIIRKPI